MKIKDIKRGIKMLKVRLENSGKIRLSKKVTQAMGIERGSILGLKISHEKIILYKLKGVKK